jgi:hypothetical protein
MKKNSWGSSTIALNSIVERSWGSFSCPFQFGFVDWDKRQIAEKKAAIAKKAYNGIEWT